MINLDKERSDKIFEAAKQVTERCFMPLTMGGSIESVEDADEYINEGADKIIIGSEIVNKKGVIEQITKKYGSQSIVCSLDYRKKNQDITIYRERGKEPSDATISERVAQINNAGVGELYLNGIERDGTGNGYDMKTATEVLKE